MIAVQTVAGNAVTDLSWLFDSMVNTGDYQYGCNENGIFLLNTTTHNDNGTPFTSTFELATTDMGISNPKVANAFYIGFDGVQGETFDLSLTADGQAERTYTVTPLTSGLQRIRVPVGRNNQGRYWRVKISSQYKFRIDRIDGMFTVRSFGIKGY